MRPADDLIGLPERGDLVGSVINRKYRVDARVGQGGLSDVYEVLYVPGACRQAMKVLRADASAEDTRRFEHEYRTLLHLDHPALVRVYDYDVTSAGRSFFTMELLRGRSLERAFDLGERVRPARVVRIALQVCSALAALHRNRVIHRDIKPGNIVLLDETGDDHHDRVKVVDLGIARLTTGYYEVASNVLELTPRDQRLRTRPGFVLGTPGYMAPECGVTKADERQDIFAVGVTMYRLLTGKRAFPTGDPRHAPITAYLPDAPPVLTALVERALAQDPEVRFASVDAMRRELERALELLTSSFSPPAAAPHAPRRWPRLVVGFALGTAATSATFLAAESVGETDQPMLDPVAVAPRSVMQENFENATESTLDVGSDHQPAAPPHDLPPPRAEPSPGPPDTKRKPASPRAVFRRAMRAARATATVCLSDLAVDTSAPITVRVDIDDGRIADITRVGAPLPSVVDECLGDAISKISFPRTLSGTFSYRFTP